MYLSLSLDLDLRAHSPGTPNNCLGSDLSYGTGAELWARAENVPLTVNGQGQKPNPRQALVNIRLRINYLKGFLQLLTHLLGSRSSDRDGVICLSPSGH